MLFERAIVKIYFVGAILKMCYFWKSIVQKHFLRQQFWDKAIWLMPFEKTIWKMHFVGATLTMHFFKRVVWKSIF